MRAKLEETPQWIEYTALPAKKQSENSELISKALVETYIQLDKDLRLLEEGGLMVHVHRCNLRTTYSSIYRRCC
jgi:hypothetical protein